MPIYGSMARKYVDVYHTDFKRLNSDENPKIKKKRLDKVGNISGFVKEGHSFNSTITWYYKKIQ